MSEALTSSITMYGNWAVAFSTVVLAFLTAFLWREATKARHYNQSADVVVSFEPHPIHTNAINLVIENIGEGLASNVQLSLPEGASIDFKNRNSNAEKYKLQGLSLFKENIPFLKSRQKITHFAFLYPDLENPSNVKFSITVSWDDYRKKREQRVCDLSVSFYHGTVSLGEDPLHEIAKAHKKLSDKIGGAIWSDRLKIETITSKEAEERTQELIRSYQAEKETA